MDETDRGMLLDAVESAKKNGIAPECFQPNDAILRLMWYVVQYLLDEWGLK